MPMFRQLFKPEKPKKVKKPGIPFTTHFSKNLNQLILEYLNVHDLQKLTPSNKADLESQIFVQIPARQLLKYDHNIYPDLDRAPESEISEYRVLNEKNNPEDWQIAYNEHKRN